MALIEKINQLKQQGLQEPEIIKTLQEQGHTPKAISEGLSQAKIKDMVTNDPAKQAQQKIQEGMQPSLNQNQESESESEPSVGQEHQPYTSEQQTPVPSQQPQVQAPQAPQAQQQYPQEQYQQPQYQQDQYPQQQPYQDQGQSYYDPNASYQEQGAYAQDQGQYYNQSFDLETVRDIAKQTLDKEISDVKKQIDEVLRIKHELTNEMKNLDLRLTRIENTMQELQSAILKKIGDYGDSVKELSQDLAATQESFGKLVNPILDNRRRGGQSSSSVQSRASSSSQTSSKPRPKSSSRNSNSSSSESFEDYFR